MKNKPLQIDIVSDVACPWCYIGKKHLEKALESFDSQPVEITWHPYQLDPLIPTEGVSRDDYFTKKFGNIDQIKQIFQRVSGVGEKAGITFNFDKMTKAVNTISLHKMLHIAREEGMQIELEERFFKAYFTDGVDFSEKELLITFMQEFGWNRAKTESILANEEITYHVSQEIKHFQGLGVSGVPFFILNNKYGISGAQPINVFLDTLNKVAAEMQHVGAVGEVCAVEGKNC
jgi:predicted DsbA family dithiol-disulfide isomerase